MLNDFNSPGNQEDPENISQKNNTPITRLRRSRTNKLLFGVCGGIGEYFRVDPVFIRLLFVLSLFMGGWGAAIYFVLIFAMPGSGESSLYNNESVSLKNLFGTFFIFLGIYLLFRKTEIFIFFTFFGLSNEIFFPLILFGFGFVLILRKGNSFASYIQENTYRRSLYDRKISGVCGGLSSYFGIDSSIVRILWASFSLVTLGIGIILYLLFLLVPTQKDYSFAENI